MAQITINAKIRDKKGKEAARKIRRNKEVPAVFYGPDTEPILLTVGYSQLQTISKKALYENLMCELVIDSNGSSQKKMAMVKDIQTDPIKDRILHVDFYEISMDKEITVDVPIHLLNTPVGVSKGGILEQTLREITISCLPGNLVESLDVDVSSLDIGDSIHIGDIKIPEGIKILDRPDTAIATVVAPTKVEEEAVSEEVEEEEAPIKEETEEETE